MFELWDRPLDLSRVVDAVSHPAAGAVDVFLGVVRDHNEGHLVTRLEYEAYETMAVAEMHRIRDELLAKTPELRLATLHRTGSLQPGDLAVVCAASSTHRGEAFAACRELIDAIKARVPIWKREWGPEGPYWVGWQDARCTPEHHQHHHPAHAHGAHAHGPAAKHMALRMAVVTVSDTRTEATDTSGAWLREAITAQGHHAVSSVIVRDEQDAIRASVRSVLDDALADVVVLTGGTGIAARDQTIEAVESLIAKKLDGFGEAFRARSWEQVGARAMLSRAMAGTYRNGMIVVLPGSQKAVELAMRELVFPMVSHAIALLRGHTAHA